MSRTVRCPACSATLAAPAEAPGKLRCPKCGTVVTVPREEIPVARVAAPPARRGRKLGLVVGWAGVLALFGFCCVPSLVSVFRGAASRSTATEAAKAPAEPDVGRLVEDLHSDSAAAREKAAKRLAGVKDLPREAVAALLDVWQGEFFEREPDRKAAWEVIRTSGPAGYRQLAMIAKDRAEPAARRHWSLMALWILGSGKDSAVRMALGDPADLLNDAGEHDGYPVWFDTATVLVSVAPEDKRVVPALVRGLRHNETTRQAAVATLGQLGPRAAPAVPLLREIADGDPGYEGQRSATSAQALRENQSLAKDMLRKITGQDR
jgi:phage FluMu protein Com